MATTGRIRRRTVPPPPDARWVDDITVDVSGSAAGILRALQEAELGLNGSVPHSDGKLNSFPPLPAVRLRPLPLPAAVAYPRPCDAMGVAGTVMDAVRGPADRQNRGFRVLVADPNDRHRSVLVTALDRDGYESTGAADRPETEAKLTSFRPDLVLLDVLLPGSGLELCRQIRSRSELPIILTADSDSELDAVLGLELGADGYLSKPFRIREMLARVHALLRRSSRRRGPEETGEVIEVGAVRVDLGRHEVSVQGELIHLPVKEFALLTLLISEAGSVVSRNRLIDSVWGPGFLGSSNILDVHIKRLRARIEVDPSQPRIITTSRGVGYRFEDGRAQRPDSHTEPCLS